MLIKLFNPGIQFLVIKNCFFLPLYFFKLGFMVLLFMFGFEYAELFTQLIYMFTQAIPILTSGLLESHCYRLLGFFKIFSVFFRYLIKILRNIFPIRCTEYIRQYLFLFIRISHKKFLKLSLRQHYYLAKLFVTEAYQLLSLLIDLFFPGIFI